MKKFKKIFSAIACCALILVSSVALTGCSEEEIKKNTETITETTIETSSSIIPVELSKETAQGIYAVAIENLITSQTYEIQFSGEQGENGVSTSTEIGVLNSKGQRFIYIHSAFAGVDADEQCLGYYDEKYCMLDLETKKYYEEASQQGVIFGSQITDNLFGYMFDNIVGGRYYNGYYYVSAQIKDSTKVDFVEVLIKDNKIVKAHFVSSENNKIMQYAQYDFYYDNIDTSKVVMSLDGYTKAN